MAVKNNKYDNSKPFDVHTWSDYKEVNKTVDAIYAELKQSIGPRTDHKLQKKHVKVVILDLWAIWLIDKKMYIGYHRGRNKYKGTSRYNKLHISFKTVAIVDELAEKGYAGTIPGFDDKRKNGKSRNARMWAKPKLIKLIEKDCVPEMIQTHPDTECIILRDEDKNDIEYDDTEQTVSMRNVLIEYNNLLRASHFDIPGYPVEGAYKKSEKKKIKLNRSNKFVRRIFNNSSWDDGGRYYGGWWQHIPSEWRDKIRTGYVPTVEIDYSGLHIVILYAMEGIDYWKTIKKDVYTIEGYEKSDRMRQFLKVVLLTILNCKNETAVCASIRNQITDGKTKKGKIKKASFPWVMDAMNWESATNENIKILLNDFKAPHEPILKYFHSSYGAKLQNIDSRMAEIVISRMMKVGIPVLCVHDSFIVIAQKYDLLKKEMNRAFNQILDEVNQEKKKDEIVPKIKDSGKKVDWFGAGCETVEDLYKKQKEIEKKFKKVIMDPVNGDQGYIKRLRNWKVMVVREKSEEYKYNQKVKKRIDEIEAANKKDRAEIKRIKKNLN